MVAKEIVIILARLWAYCASMPVMNPHLNPANMWQPWQPWTLSSPGFWSNMLWNCRYWWVFSFAAGGHIQFFSLFLRGWFWLSQSFWGRRSSSKQQSNLESEASCLVASTHIQLNQNFPWHHNLFMGCTTWTVFKTPCRPLLRRVSWEQDSPCSGIVWFSMILGSICSMSPKLIIGQASWKSTLSQRYLHRKRCWSRPFFIMISTTSSTTNHHLSIRHIIYFHLGWLTNLSMMVESLFTPYVCESQVGTPIRTIWLWLTVRHGKSPCY